MLKLTKRCHSSKSAHKFDICILGGGIVGTALACSIAQSQVSKNLKIGLIEAGDLFSNQIVVDGVFSNRVSSFTPTSVDFLDKLKVWEKIPFSRKHCYTNMQVWDSVCNGKIEFEREKGVAFISENRLIQAALARSASCLKNITVLNNTKVKSIDEVGLSPYLTLENGERVSAGLLVGADGANSAVRQFAGINTVGYKYNQRGLVGTVSLAATKNETAWQRFLPTGPLALLPVSDTHSSIVWSLKGDLAEKLCKLGEKDFVSLLNAAFHNPVEDVIFLLSNLGNPGIDFKTEMDWGNSRSTNSVKLPPVILSVCNSSLATFPLQLQHSHEYCASNIALVGDAAHSIHPLAGQGLNLGLADAEALSRLLITGIDHGQLVSDPEILNEYARERFLHNSAILLACDSLSRLFSNDSQSLSLLRSFGLNLLNSSSLLKSILVKLAS